MEQREYQRQDLWGVTLYFYCERRGREISCACADNRDAIRQAVSRDITEFRLVHEIQAWI